MTKGIRIATIVIGGAWCVLAAGCSEPPNRPAALLSAKPATQLPPPPASQPAQERVKEDSNSVPSSEFISLPGYPHHIVYVVDASGSMAPTFQKVQARILKSVSRLYPTQNFSIIFFGEQLIQSPQKGLVAASPENKIAASTFIKDVTPGGSTAVLPALRRAMQLLKSANPREPGRLIFLLSDGDFAGIDGGSRYTTFDGKTFTGNQAVIQWLRDNNPKEEKKGRVHVCTFLYLNREPEPIRVMETIAKENAGRFKLISIDE